MAYGSQGGGGFEGAGGRGGFLQSDHPLPKKVTVIDPTAFTSSAPNQTTAPSGDALIEFAPTNMDLFRYRLGAFWNGKGDTNHFEFKKDGVIESPTQLSNTLQFKPVKYKPPHRLNNINEPLGEFKETITIQQLDNILNQVSGKRSRDKWLKMLDGAKTSAKSETLDKIVPTGPHLREGGVPKEFYDHVCEIEVPLDEKEVGDNFYGSVRTMIASVNPVYNFYISPYEGVIREGDAGYSVPEQLLPNLYSFLTVLQSEDDETIDTIFEQQVTLNNTLKDVFATKEVLNKKGEKVQTKVSKGQYFEKYSYGYIRYDENGYAQAEKQNLLDRFTNLVVPMSNLNLFVDYNDKADQFPMYCDINFSTDVSTKVADSLKKSKLCSVFLKDVMEDKIANFKKPNLPFNFYPIENLPFAPDNANAGADESESLKNWDITAWVQNLIKNPVGSYSNMTKGVFLGKYDEEINMATGNDSYNFFKNLMVIVFTGKFQRLIETKTRNYKEILEGKKAYHETAFYKIEKWAANSGGVPTTHIQNYYLPNSSDIDTHRIIDTQVKYDKRYIYRIYAYELIFGTKYSYSFDEIPKQWGRPPNGFTIDNTQAKMCVIWTPSVKMIEIPYYQTPGPVIVMDSPPVWPNINIVPYRAVKNKLLFMFEGNVGNYKLQPILLQPGDKKIIDKIREAQRLGPNDPVIFKSDDQARQFQIFRMTSRPASYSDFSKIKPITVETDQFDVPCKFANSAAYVDIIMPNTKYYYIFRVLDNHGHFSNPSVVYEVEIVYDAGSPFLQMKTIEFEKIKEPVQTPLKSFKKYVRITPARDQREVNLETSGLVDVDPPPQLDPQMGGDFIQLGTSDETAWGKKFKIRLISKKTGKKIDINLDMVTEHIKSQNDTNNNLC